MSKKGSIFLSVILGTSIAIALSIALNYFARVEINKSYNFRYRSEARILSRSIIDALKADPISIPPYELSPKRWIRVESEDLERYININTIILPDGKTLDIKWEKIFERILRLAGAPIDLLPKICDFIDTDKDARLGGYEGEENLNRRLYLLEEILRMRDLNKELYDKVFSKYFTAVSSGRININTAPKEVLMALSEEIDEEVADAIIEFRRGEKIERASDLKKIPGFPEKIIPQVAEVICFDSKYYRLKVEVKVEEAIFKTEVVVSDGRIIYEREGW